MAKVIVTLKLMPENPESDLDKVQMESDHLIKEFGGELGRADKEPVAFGLVALKLVFVMDEALGSTEELEEKLRALEGVASVEVSDIRRAIG